MGLGPQDRAQGAIHAAARERRRGHAVGESSPDQAEPAITSRSVAAQHEQVVLLLGQALKKHKRMNQRAVGRAHNISSCNCPTCRGKRATIVLRRM